MVFFVSGSFIGYGQNRAVDLSALGNKIDITYDLDLINGFTIESWIQFKSQSASNVIFGETTGAEPNVLEVNYIGTSGPVYINLGNGALTAQYSPSQAFTNDQWYHVALTFDPNGTSSESYLYIDGVLGGSKLDIDVSALGNGGGLSLGARNDGNNNSAIWMDEVRIWNTARSAGEISANKDVSLVGNETNLQVYYQFDGDVLTDLAGGNQNGTASGTIGYVAGAPIDVCVLPTITEFIDENTFCSGANGSIAATATTSGGEPTGNYMMTIYAGVGTGGSVLATNSNIDGVTGLSASSLTGGNYTIEVVNNDTGCSSENTYAINDNPTLPIVNTGSVTNTDESYAGANDGALDATGTASGGTGPYTYQWYSDVGLTVTEGSGAAITGLAAGTYYLEVIDDETGCIVTESVAVSVAPNYALDFDGTDDYVDLGTAFNPLFNGTNTITVESWVYLNTSQTTHTIVSNYGAGNQFFLRVDSGKPVFWIDSGGLANASGATTLATNTWIHLAGTWDGTTLKVYVDGVLDGSTAKTGTFANASGTVRLSSHFSNEHLNGALDDVRVWNVTRTASEILDNKDNELVGSESGLVAYYDFSNGVGTTLSDKVGSNDGTLINFAHSGSSSNWIATGPPLGAPDTIAPAFNSVPTVTQDDNDATLTVQLDEIGQAHWGVYDQANTPSAEDVKNGIGAGGVIFGALNVPAANVDAVQLINSLLPSTSYYLYVASEDAAGNLGTPVEKQFTTTSAPENAMSFDGVDDYVDLPASLKTIITEDFTVEAWINPNSIDRYAGIVDNMEWTGGTLSGYILTLHETGELVARMYTGNDAIFDIRTPISAGSWQHVAMTYDGIDFNLYLNGQLSATTPATGAIDYSPVPPSVNIGRFQDSNEEYFFDGLIDEVRIWNVARTQGEIQSTISTSLSSGSGLIASYIFNQSSYTLLDQTVNGYNGGLNGGVGYVASTAFLTDLTAPTFNSTPTVTYDDNDATLTLQMDEVGTAHWGVYDQANTPSAEDVKNGIGAGQVNSGALNVPTANIDAVQQINGLLPSTTYYLYVVSEDASGNNGTPVEIIFSTDPAPENAGLFDGSDDFMDAGSNGSFEFTSGTIEMWVKPAATTDNEVIVGVRGADIATRWSLHINEGSNVIGVWDGASFGTVSTAIVANEWYHLAFNIDGTDTEVFVNGTSAGFAGNGMSATTGVPLLIGSPGSTNPNEFFTGEIDELRIWNVQRTPAEINANISTSLATPLTEGNLVAYYTFNQSSYTLLDQSINGYNAGLNGGVGYVPSTALSTVLTPPNYALDFDGVNDYVNTDLAFSGQVFTAEFWVNPGSAQVNYASILDNNHNGSQGWTFIQNNSNLNEYWFFSPSSVNAYVTLPADTWSHVALVHNNVSLEKKIYLNGVLVANVAVTGDINYVTPDLYIGDWVSNTGTRPFNGQIDEVRIWSTARSTSEIVEYKDVKLSGTEPNLVAYYDFSDGPSSSTLTDQSLNSNNGILNNMDPANDWIDAGFSLGDPYPFTIYNLVVTPDNNDALVDITTSTNVDLYYVITTTNDVPSPAQIQAGLNQAGSQAFNYSNYGGVTGAANFGVGDTNHTSGNDLISGNTYFIHWVGENAGQYSNILSAEFTTTTPPPPSDITITTISVSGGNLPQGSTDNLVYSFQMDVTTSNAAAQGFQFNLAGTSVDADFEVNGVTLDVSTVSDFSSGVTSLPGTYDPANNNGGADIQILDATEYVAGTTYYFRLSLDIAPGATAANTFNVIAPVEGNFFFSNGIGTFNDGAITAGNTFTIGTPNYALDFDGTDEYITTTKNSISTTLTVEAWVTLSTLSPVNDINSIVSKWNASNRDFSLNWTKSTNTFYAQVFHEGTLTATTATGTFQPVVDTWYHIAMTYDGEDVNLYVDGVLDATAPIVDGLDSTPGSNVWIGSVEQNATGRDWSGKIDEVRIWDVARSASQINAFKNVELSGSEPDLALYYAFSDGPNASTTTDNSTYANVGTLTNMDAASDWVEATHGIAKAGVLDTTNPTASISSSEFGTTTLATIPITITFSEEVANFDLADITVGNGTVSNLSTSDDIVFTADITPISGGFVTVDILSDVVTDLTGNGNDASAQFSIDYIAPENALDFDGVDDNILGSGINLANSDFTIEVWFNTSSPTSSQTIISVGDSETANETLHIRLENSDVRIGLAFDDVVVPWTVTTGWHHLAVIHNTSTRLSELYIDGELIGSGTHSNPFIGNTNFKMGSNGWSVSALFEGEMDDIRIWNVARTPTQILGNLTTLLSSAPGLVASYGFNHPSGSLLADLSGNGNDGTLTNFDFLGTSSDWVASTVPSCAPSGKFIGSANSDWSNPANWCGGVVPAANNVVENIVVSINSDITETQDLVLNANDFQVASGASLVLNLNSNSVQLTNNATFTNNGTVNVSNGTGVNATAGSFINNGVFFFDAGTQLASPEGTFINYGILKGFFTVNNNFTNPSAGTVAPGASPGCANFVSDFTNSGTLEVEIDGTIPCSQYDQISVGGTAYLGGTLNVTLGFTPVSGNEFVIIDATAISGTFATVNLPDANWSIAYDFPATGQVSLSYVDPTEMIGSTGPGGVGATDGTSPLQLWVKADAGTGTTTDDVTVSTWTDQSGFGRNMTGVNSPSFKNNIINGMPVLQFAAGQFDYFEAPGFTDNFTATGFTIFTVAQMTGTGDQGFIGFKSQTGNFNGNVTFFLDDVNGTATDLRVSSPSTGTLGSTQWASDNRSPRLLSFTRSTSLLNAYDGGTNVVSNLAEGAIFNGTDPWMIGRYNNDNLKHFTGDVAEFVLFEGVLNTASRTIVENHLSAKYDIAHSVDLYAGDTAPNGDFDFDVIGIGMEADGSDPGGAAGGIILTNAGFLQDDGDYLFAGHDGSAHGFVQTDLPGSYTNRWARSWYVDVTDSTTVGTGGLVTVTFDFDEAGLGLPNANLALITRPGTTGNYAVASTDFLMAGNKVSFTLDASAIIDGHTYTIADDFVPNNALLFDGVAGNFVQGPDLTSQIANDFTFETWFRTTASDHRMMIALGDHLGGAGAQAQLKVNSNSVIFGVNALSSVVSPSATYTDGSWHHAAGVYSGTLLTLYLDGELIDTTSAPLTMDLSAFKIGDHSGGNLVWDGELDNMRIWNVARTQSEIIANAYNTLSTDSTLVVSYDFNSSTGTTLFDLSANSLNGTLVGTPPAWVSSTAWDIDIFAPTFEAGYPTITNINQNDFDLTVQLNEEGAVYYVVLPDSATVPSIDDIKAGTDGLGGAAVVASNFPVNLIGSEVIANITGLTDGTSYDVYVVAEDNEGAPNTQKVAVTFDITTLAFPENALSFDGTDDYVDITHNTSQNLSTFTLEAWVKTEQAAGAHIRIIMKPVAGNQNYSLAINNGYAHVRFDGSGGVQAEGTTLINDGKWHHLAGVFDNANDLISIYVDGVLEQQNATAQNPVTGSSPLYLGWSGVGQHYEGEMDQVRIWNTVRTQEELINHMNQSLNAEAGLVASYDFNTGIPGGDNTGLNTLADISGNGHDGTLNAFDLVGDTSNWVASGAFAPIIYQVSAANLNNLSVNWQPTNRGQIYVDINDASNFAGVPHATGYQIGNGSNSTSIVTGLSLAPNTRYFARIYYQDGGFTSPYSDTVEFMINAGSALAFDGTDDVVTISDDDSFDFANTTLEGWFYFDDVSTTKYLISRYDGSTVTAGDISLSIQNQKFRFQIANDANTWTGVNGEAATTLVVSTWYHLSGTFDGSTVKIYINGVEDASVPTTGTFTNFTTSTRPFQFGSLVPATNLFSGQMDEVRIWNTVRSQTEIQSSINNTLGGNENGLAAYYRFDEGDTAAVNTGITSPEVIDLSGNGNAGTMSGFAKTGVTSNWVASGAMTLDNNTAPLAPTGVIAFSNSSNNIILQWKDNAHNETGYLIENADDYDFTLNVDTVVADLGVNATSFVHSAGADQGYFYRVTPVNGFETGASTSEVEFATTKPFPGYALNFDGIADSVDMGSTGDLQISGALTYEVWIKTTQTQGFILGKRNSSDLADLASNIELDGTGKIQGLVYDGIAGFPDVIQSNVAVNDGEWHHVAFVFEPSVALRLYIDGVLDKTFGISSTNINGASYPFRVGKYPTSSSVFFDGEMDEIRVWNDVRSDAEIFDNLYHDLKGDESNLVAYYPMDENSGTKLVDRSVNTNDGDIGGAGFIVSDVPLGPPMYLLSSTPSVNETNIARSANIQMTFDANVDAATLNGNIVVMGSHSGIITGVFFGGGTSVITFDPDNDFLAGEYVSAIISEKVRGLNGEVAVPYNLQFAIATGPFQGAFVEQTTGLEGVVDGAAAWADYDGDGDLDVAVSGWDFDYTFVIAKIFNNSGGTFTDIGASLTGVYEGSLDWGDYDGDGDLDLFATGFNDGGSRTASLYQNNAGTFSDVGGSFQGVSYSEADWGDFDNDGDLDLAVQGDYTASLSSTSIYVNEGGTFTTLNAGLVGANTGDLSWGDYDNDGDLDLVSMGYTSNSASVITTIYRNDNGVFTDIAAGLEGKYYGSVNWGDYDNDNDLDLLVSGSNTDNAPIIYRNDAGTFVDISAGLLENAEGESAWGDFDGDGDLDVVINGSGETNDPTTTIYTNNAGTFVIADFGVTNYLYSTVDWGDYDNDGDLDLLLTGTDDFNGGRIALFSNALAPPKVLNATSVSTAGFTPNLIAPSGAVDLIVDVSTDPQFGSFISQDVSVGISGGVDINTTLTAGTQYFYRAKTDFGGGEESSYYISNSFMIQPGNALPFTGDDYVEVFDNPVLEPTDDFTIEFWFNTNVTGNRVFVEKGTGNTEYSVQQYSGDVLGLNVNGAMQTNGSYNDSTWHHAAFIYRGPGDGTIYVDGVEDVNAGSVAALGAPTYSLGRLTIGDRRFGGSFNIEGIIDEVRIWDDERTLTEIDDHRYKTLIGDEQGLIAYYQFDELSGLGLKNLSDNLSLDGSLENMVGNEWIASGALGAFGTVVSITADEANPAGSAIASELDWNIQFTSPVTGLTPGNFTLNSSGIGGGSSVSSVTDVDGFNWTITATVDAGDGTIGVDFTNDAGLNTTITNAPFVGEVYTVDRTVPTVALSSSEPDPTNSGTFTVDVVFSEGVTGLLDTDFVVGNGSASNLVDIDGTNFTVDITAVSDGIVTVDLGSGSATDAAGNGNDGATQFSITVDQTAPVVSLSTTEPDPTNSGVIPISITFSEGMSGFDVTDLTVGNGAASNFVDIDGTNYSADIYPSSDGLVTVDISAGVAFDAASNGNEAAPTLSITYDATVPTLDFVGIYSSNSNSIWAMVGDDVFVDFTSSEGIENVIVYIAGNVATIDDLADANDQTWSASYTMQVGDTEGSIPIAIDFQDLSGNMGNQVTTTTDASDVAFDKTDPNITGNSAHNIIENTTAIGTYSSGEIVIWSLSGDDVSSLLIDGAGSLSFVSNPDFESPGDFNGDNVYDVVVEATDEAGNVATLAVSITVTDEDEINPVISGNITPSVQENTTSVGTYTADESVTWSLSGTDASEFSISSGVLSFISPPDFESPSDAGSNNVYDLIVTGTDAAGNIGTLAVSVTVTDVDEINPVISGSTTPSVQENTTSVGTYTADESVTWSLSGTDASAFSISSGVLSFLSPPDFESPTDGGANNVYDLIVTGTDGAGNIGTLAVSVTVTNVDEINPVISGSTTPSVQENMTAVGTYTADESVTWSLSGTDASAFSISSGVLSFLSPPDFESPTDGGANNVYDLIVTGTDAAGNIGTLAVSVTVTDVDEINPVISGSTTPSVQENTTSVGTYTANESVTWSLSGTDASAFSISSGVLNFLSPPDFESPTDGGANNVYDLIVTGTDGAGNIGTLAVSVTVTDLDEIDPVVSGDDLPELVEGETLVGNYTADETVTWSLAGVDASFFTLSTGGELSFASAPDYGTPLDAGSDNIYEVTLQATDGAGNVGSLAVSVKVLQSDVVPPVITGNDIPELPENTTLVGAYTADESVTWSLSGEDASLFSVNTSGELSLLTEADFEVPSDADGNNTYLLTITATDGQGNFSDLSLVVTVTDANDNTPEIVDPGSVSVDENSEAGTLVVGLMATDADTGTTFSWSLGTGNEDLDGDGSAPFIIDEATGDLTVNDPDDLDYESGTISFSLQVIVEDGANAQGITVFIEVNDLDETIAVSFDEVVTNDPSPALTGTVDDLEAGIEVSVDGSSYQAENNGDGTWQLAGAVIADLSDGTYEVTVTATGLSGGQFGSVTGTLIIDLLAPSISIDALVTNITSPELTGTVDDQDAVIQVTVNGIDYEANNLGDGSWILAAGVIESLSEGIYEVTVMATDAATNEGTAAGTLEIDTSAPVVTVDALETLKDSPSISGSVDDSEASVEITVNGNTYEAVVTGTIWMVEEGTIASLAVGTYDVLATASDAAGNSAEDASTDELVIKPGAPTALAATNVDYFSFNANWKERSGVASYRLDVSSDAAFVNLLSGFDNLSTTATSVAVTGLNYGSVYHYRVRAVYASGDVSGNSNVISVTTPTDAGTLADSLALLSIYEAAGGASWTRTNNWKTTLPLRQWSDISMTGTRVTTVDLSSNNLTGSFPEISEGLEFLTTLDLSGNLLTSLPSLTSLSGLTSLDVSDNKLGFASLEPNAGISGIVYSPQKAAGERIETLEQQGTNFTIDRTVSGSANSYKWFKENLKTNAVTELTNTGSSLTIVIESFNDEGGYFVEVTNDLVSGLTITSEPVILKVSSLERDFAALQNIYDAMGGESWSGEASNWPNETDFADWEGVEIQSERVVGLKLDSIDMTGELPKDILDIAGLKDVDLSGNRISKIPNMTSLSLTSLNVSGNNLEFDDLEPNVQISGISYANQRLIGAAKNDTIVHGSDFTILLEVGGSANAYQWNRTNDLGTGPVSGATSNSYTIEGISYETMGVHTLTVTNSKVPGLTLTSRKQRVLATANLTFTALDLNNELFTEGDGMALRVTAPGNPYDTIQVVRGSTEGFVFEDLILGDYLIAVRADDLVEFLPTYYPSTDLWKEAEEYILREDGEETLRMAQIPPPLPPLPDGGVVGGTIESDFADEEEEDEGGRIESRRKVKRAGCSMRRFVRSGRIDQDGEFILYAYVESDDEGRFNFKDIEPGLYRFNIEYPGIPMDPESFVEFEIGADGKERNSFTLEATVTEEGIVVEKINELGFYRKYFKDLNVYPNPSDEVMHVSYAKMLAQGVVMRLVDLKGNVVLEQAVERGYDMALELDVREIPAGVYLLNFVDTLDRKRSVVTYRVVIRH
ncbi:LamG-like jellyroll fold domain-containing protein [Marinoscillum sp.]|uniref:LamG-like jellyroll fold domain-containing protein n=1 Tax=Marinoscillum sp. TaxID=2024838 RepID=UPI003BAB7DB1